MAMLVITRWYLMDRLKISRLEAQMAGLESRVSVALSTAGGVDKKIQNTTVDLPAFGATQVVQSYFDIFCIFGATFLNPKEGIFVRKKVPVFGLLHRKDLIQTQAKAICAIQYVRKCQEQSWDGNQDRPEVVFFFFFMSYLCVTVYNGEGHWWNLRAPTVAVRYGTQWIGRATAGRAWQGMAGAVHGLDHLSFGAFRALGCRFYKLVW